VVDVVDMVDVVDVVVTVAIVVGLILCGLFVSTSNHQPVVHFVTVHTRL